MATYTLPDVTLPSGTLSTTLYSSVAGLTAPTFPSLLIPGVRSERVDTVAGAVDLAEMEFGFIEDYSVHSAGFWHTVLNGTLEIQLTLDDGSVYKHFFWGLVNPLLSTEDEVDLTSGSIVRRSNSFKAVSVLTKMQSFAAITAITGLESDSSLNATGPYGGTYGIMGTPQDLIAECVSLAFSQSFVTGNVILPASHDIQFHITANDSTNYYDMSNSYILLEIFGGSGGIRSTLLSKYATAYDLMMAVCKTFGVFPVHYYDTNSSQHQIQLVNRGRTFSSYATLPMPLAPPEGYSKFYPMGQNLLINQSLAMPSGLKGSNPHKYGAGYMLGSSWFATDAPQLFSSDLDTQMLFGCYGGAFTDFDADNSHYEEMLWQLHDPVGGVYEAEFFQRVRSWNYAAAAYGSDEQMSLQAMGEYLFFRLGNYTAKRAYDRVYPGVAATISGGTYHNNVKLGMTTQINDGVSTRNFFASDIQCDLMRDLMTIHWIEI